MPDLGTKHECYNCGTRFYDLGKAEAICPKCGANQKDAVNAQPAVDGTALRRKRKDDLLRRTEYEDEAAVGAVGETATTEGEEELEVAEGAEGAEEEADETQEE